MGHPTLCYEADALTSIYISRAGAEPRRLVSFTISVTFQGHCLRYGVLTLISLPQMDPSISHYIFSGTQDNRHEEADAVSTGYLR